MKFFDENNKKISYEEFYNKLSCYDYISPERDIEIENDIQKCILLLDMFDRFGGHNIYPSINYDGEYYATVFSKNRIALMSTEKLIDIK